MRTLCSIFIYLVIFVFVDFRLNAQVYEPEGINIPGAWNSWTNSNDTSTMDNFRLQKRNFGGGQYTTTLQISSDLSQTPDATPGTYEWLFTSGPNTGLYNNKWGTSSDISFVTINPVFHQGANNTTTVEDNSYYTITFKDQGYSNTDFSIQKLSQQPITFENIIGVPTTSVSPSTSVNVKVILSSSKASEEKIYLRYSIDDFTTSSAIEFTSFNGDTGTVTIPAITSNNNTIVKFYILSTTIDKSLWGQNVDLFTLSYLNNSSNNYSYTVLASPSQVSLSSPSDDASGVVLQPTLSWSSSARSTEYDVQVSTDGFSSYVINATTTDTSYSVGSALEYGTTYSWRVRGTNTTGDGDWSSEWDFTTKIERPSQVSLSSPSDDASGVVLQPTLSWSSSARSTEYDVQVSTDGFSSYVINATTTDTSYSVGSALEYGTTYSWRVRGTNTTGDGDWSSEWDFTTKIERPSQVSLSSPSDDASGVVLQPTLSWSSSARSTEYDVQVSTDGFSSYVINATTTDTSYSVGSALEYGTTYSWRVRGTNTTGDGDWSSEWDFTTKIERPSQVSLSSPSDDASGVVLQPTLSWSSSARSTEYDVQVSTDGFSSYVINATTTDTSYSVGSALEYGTTYSWRVRGTNTTGDGDWSSEWDFTTKIERPSQVSLSSPSDDASGVVLQPTLSWSSSARSTEYDVQVSTDGFSSYVINATTTDTSYSVGSALEYGTTYSWRVRGTNTTGDGDWSSEWDFTTKIERPSQVSLSSPSDDASGVVLQPTLSWSSSARSTEYDVQVSTDGFSSYVINATTTDTSYSVGSALEYGTTYSWRVRGTNTTGDGDWSSEWDFTTKIERPSQVSLSSPSDDASGVVLQPTLSWSSSARSTEYDVQVSTDGFSSYVINATTTDTSYSVGSALEYGTTYSWRVRGTNTTGDGDWSSEWDFTTKIERPSQVSLSSPSDDASGVVLQPTLSWSSSARSTEYDVQVSTDGFSSYVINATTTDTSYSVGSALEYGTTYSWRVRGTNTTGDGDWSSEWDFTTKIERPSQVSLSSPSDDASGVVLQPTLSWSSSARSTEYDVQVSLDSSFNDTSKFALVRENISANTYSIKNPLEYGNNYFWRVRGTNTTGDGDWSSVWDFWTDFRPNLELPLNGSTKISTPVKLKWGMQVKSNYFDIQVAQDKSFDDLTINLIDYDSTQIIISDLNDNELYYWRVRAKVSKTITYWSDIYSFSTTQLKPDTVIVESPIDSTNDASIPVAFSWRQAYLANSYQLQISESNGFSFFSDTSVTDTTILLSNFNSGTDYYWRIRSVNDSGFSSWSVINNLNIGVGGFEGPLLIFPDNNAVDLGEQLKLTWETMKGADNYQLQIAYSNDFVDIFIDTTEVMDEELLVQGLENGMNYFWRVRATDSESASAWSEVYSFSTAILPPNKISIIQPASSSEDIDLPVTFIWKQSVTADYYELKFGDTEELSNSITLSDITDTTVTLENLNYDSRYFWKVRGINSLDNGPWSEVYSFSTGLPIPDFPVLVHPQNNDDLRPPIRFGWNSTEFTDSYHLQVSQDELFKNIVFDSTLSKQTLEIAALDEIKKYYWRLKSINRLFTSEWSEVRNFNLISLTNTEDELVIEEFALHQNFPNPFNPSTVITFDVKNVQDVKVQVFDLSGRLVKTLVNNKTSPGRHQVVFDASSLSSGVYLLRMQAGYFIDTKKITLIK